VKAVEVEHGTSSSESEGGDDSNAANRNNSASSVDVALGTTLRRSYLAGGPSVDRPSKAISSVPTDGGAKAAALNSP
jgi:hypothetical protein